MIAVIYLHVNMIFPAKRPAYLFGSLYSFSSHETLLILRIFHEIPVMNDDFNLLLPNDFSHSDEYPLQLFLAAREPNDDLFDPIRLLGFEFIFFKGSFMPI